MFWKKVFLVKLGKIQEKTTCHGVILVKLFTKVYWKEDSIADAALSEGYIGKFIPHFLWLLFY